MPTFAQDLEYESLQARYHLLELAALLDRLDLAAKRESLAHRNFPRLVELQQALAMLNAPAPGADRAERLLQHYSDPAIGPRQGA